QSRVRRRFVLRAILNDTPTTEIYTFPTRRSSDLHGDGEVAGAAQEEEVAHVAELGGDLGDLVVPLEDALDRLRQGAHLRDELFDRPGVHGAAHLGQVEAEQLHHHQLGGERLGGGDADLGPGPGVEGG